MVSLIVGVVCVLFGLWGLVHSWEWAGGARGIVMLGKALVACLPFLLVVGGVIAGIAGVSSIKEQSANRDEGEADTVAPEEKKEKKE